MLAIIIKLIISMGIPSYMFSMMSQGKPEYNILKNPKIEYILIFVLITLMLYFTCTMVQVFVYKTQNVVLGSFAGIFIAGLIWTAVILALRFVFSLFGMGDEMFTDDHIENQIAAVTAINAIFLIPPIIDIVNLIRRLRN